jgi:hypothetical protein
MGYLGQTVVLSWCCKRTKRLPELNTGLAKKQMKKKKQRAGKIFTKTDSKFIENWLQKGENGQLLLD